MFKSDHQKRLKELKAYANKNLDIPINPFEIWSTTYDIKSLDRNVVKYLKNQLENIPQYENKIKDLEEQLKTTITRVKRIGIERQIDELKHKIEDIKNNPTKYKKIASSFIEEYLYVQDEGKRMIIIEDFLKMVKKFYPHTIIREALITKADYCFSCNIKLIEGRENMYCPKCFREYEEREDLQISNVKTKIHDPINYFEKIIDQVEGKEYVNIPSNYIKLLDSMVEKRGWKKPLNRGQIVELVYASSSSEYYSHISQIAYQYAGIPLPDYSNRRSHLLEKYKQFSEIYQDIQKTLISSLNGLFVFFKLLEMEDENLELKDFKASISDQTLSQYDSIWQKACERLGWKYIQTQN